MNKRTIIVALSIVLICALILAGAALAAPTQTIDWYVIGGGGGHVTSTDGAYSLDGTIGQPVAGVASADLCSGFWCGLADWVANMRIYLPIILR